MADDRLVVGLSAWLRDSDVPAPDAQMSAGRVMAGIETTPQLGRMWPPARFAPSVEPAPALGAFGPAGPPPRPMPRVAKPRLKARLGKVITPVRALAVANVAALTVSVAFITASLLPSGPEPQFAVLAAATAPPDLAVSAAPDATPTPAPTPTPRPTWSPSDRTVDWQGDGVRLEAGALRLLVGDKVFTPAGQTLIARVDAPDRATLESRWQQGIVEHRILFELGADASDWWIERVDTNDGRKSAGVIAFEGLAQQTRTPLGASYEGDLRLKSTGADRKALAKRGAATLSIDGLRLSAFGPEVAVVSATD